MALLELDGNRYPIPVGELVLGSDAACGIVLSGRGVLPRHALFQGQPNGHVVIRKATPAAEVTINGVRLGAEPTPLLHGDKVEVDGHDLNFVDERRSGSTQFVEAVKPLETTPQTRSETQGAGVTVNTGGRLVSLTDGREYVISGASLVFGREAACDVVVDSKDVSRRHAEIVQTPKGYLIVDSSTNGTFVNEERVRGQRILTRADVVRIGDATFRFYADVMPVSSPAPAPPPPRASPPAPPVPPTPPPAQPATGVGQHASQSGSLATLVVRNGALKGQRVEVKTPVVNVGRADYNDVRLVDPSVSTSHAKIQRREGVWVLVDLDSTNGSFVDGERVRGEVAIAPGVNLKFGDVELLFEPTDDALGVGKGGGTVVMAGFPPAAAPGKAPAPARGPTLAGPLNPPPATKQPPIKQPPLSKVPVPPKSVAGAKPARPPAPTKKKGKGCGANVVVLLLGAGVVAAVVYWFLA